MEYLYFLIKDFLFVFKCLFSSHKHTEKKHMVHTDWLSARLSIKIKDFRCKSGFRNDTHTDGEIMAHFHSTEKSSATVPLLVNRSHFSKLVSAHKKHAHNFKFCFN